MTLRAMLAAWVAARRPPGVSAAVTVLWDAGARLGECPRWEPRTGSLFWVDIEQGQLHRYGLTDGARHSWTVGAEAAALALLPDGGAIVGIGDTLHRFDPVSERVTPWCRIGSIDAARCRLNDAAWAPDGSLWVTSMDREAREPLGALHRVGPARDVATIGEGYVVGNGPAFDAGRRRAYVADSPRRVVHAVDVDAPYARRAFASTARGDGVPDGMAVLPGGDLLVAHHDGACLTRWSPDGRLVARVAMPVRRPTAIAVVRDTPGDEVLVVTSARDESGGGGALLRVELGTER